MKSATTTPPDPVVMAQKIQALTANVQELMKQNEERILIAATIPFNDAIAADMTKKLAAPRTTGVGTLPSTLRNPCTVMII